MTLDKLGILFALALGALLLTVGGTLGPFFLVAMIWFLIISAVATIAGKRRKIKLKIYQEARGWRNVVANGLIPLIVVILYHLDQTMHFVNPEVLVVAYVASIAAVAADKLGSEIGVLGKATPIMLLTLKPSKIGVSGGVSALGIVAGIVGAALVSLLLIGYGDYPFYMLVVVVCGIFGSLVDSAFGYFEEKGYGNKFTSNMLGCLAGCLLALLLLTIL